MPERIGGDRWISLWRGDDGVLFVEMENAALVVPITERGDVLFIAEPSPAYGTTELVLPAGVVEPGEAAEEAAQRELREEVGLRAELRHVGTVAPMVKYVRARFDVFVGTKLTVDPLTGDEDHEVIQQPTRLEDIPALIASGRISDATVIAALALAGVYCADR